jgi:hypothetical protein
VRQGPVGDELPAALERLAALRALNERDSGEGRGAD